MNKTELAAICISMVDRTISDIRSQMLELITDSENDSKSSAGDKHETGRAMMQLAREQLGKQLQEAELKRGTLTRIDMRSVHQRIGEGSLVTTSENTLFLAAPLGKINYLGRDVFVLSAQSPLGQQLLGKRVGEIVSFNQRTITILHVE